MPLDKSKTKAAFGKNIKTEIKEGKPRKQAEAIAFSEKGEKKPPKIKKNNPAPMLGVYKKKM